MDLQSFLLRRCGDEAALRVQMQASLGQRLSATEGRMAVLEDITCACLRPSSKSCALLLTRSSSAPPHCLVRSLAPLIHFTQTALSDPMAGAVAVLKQHADKGASSESDWLEVATAGKTLADSLRSGPSASRLSCSAAQLIRSRIFAEELRGAVGEKGALVACGVLLRRLVALRQEQQAVTEDVEDVPLRAQTELVRVVGNMCFEHGKAES